MIYENRKYEGKYFPFACALMEGNLPFMNHCHKEMEILLVYRGKICVSCEGEKYELGTGDVWIVPPFYSHSIDGGDEGSLRLAVLLDLDIMGWMRKEDELPGITALLEQTPRYSGHWDTAAAVRIREFILNMYNEYMNQEKGWQLAIKTSLNAMLLTVQRDLPRSRSGQTPRQVARMRAILEYAALNYCGEISLGACAAQVGFNPAYLSRYFHQHMGITFQEYIKKLRIDRARWLLGNQRLSVTEVAYASGFKDIKTFNKLFKKECGTSPSQFRKRALKRGDD